MAPHIVRRGAAKAECGGNWKRDDTLEAGSPGCILQDRQRPRTAIGQERVLRRDDALAGNHTASADCVLLQHLDRCLRRLADFNAETSAHSSSKCALPFQHRARPCRQKITGSRRPEWRRNGDGGLRAAAIEANGAGIGSCTFRPKAHLLGQGISLDDHPVAAPMDQDAASATSSLKRSMIGCSRCGYGPSDHPDVKAVPPMSERRVSHADAACPNINRRPEHRRWTPKSWFAKTRNGRSR